MSFTSEQQRDGAIYNYSHEAHPEAEREGLSVFWRDTTGDVFHTYSTYARGIDWLNGAYALLDLTPLGRDEDGFGSPQEWVRRHDEYGTVT